MYEESIGVAFEQASSQAASLRAKTRRTVSLESHFLRVISPFCEICREAGVVLQGDRGGFKDEDPFQLNQQDMLLLLGLRPPSSSY